MSAPPDELASIADCQGAVLQVPANDMTDSAKSLTITLRLAPDEHATWVAAAAADGRSLSSWIRRQCALGAAAAPASSPRVPAKPQGPKRKVR